MNTSSKPQDMSDGSDFLQTTPDARMTKAEILGRNFRFLTDTNRDVVQQSLRAGKFYEQAELQDLAKRFTAGGVFVDIGANVGNHTMFAAAFFAPRKVICFEPNPRAIRLLRENVVANGMGDIVDLSNLGVGLADVSEGNYGMERKGKRLGSLRMLPGTGSLRVIAGDDVLTETAPNLIKIDVEGMELRVLAGLERTIQIHKPDLFVEVDNTNLAGFCVWMARMGYAIDAVYDQNAENKNYFVTHTGRPD